MIQNYKESSLHYERLKETLESLSVDLLGLNREIATKEKLISEMKIKQEKLSLNVVEGNKEKEYLEGEEQRNKINLDSLSY